MKYFLLTFNEDYADEHDVPALDVKNEEEFNIWSETKIEFSACLGNSGDEFCVEYQGKKGKRLIKDGLVDVYEVDENFANIFHKAELSGLSLCDIFDPA